MKTWLHASPIENLDNVGIKCLAAPLVSYRKSPYVFLGTMDYLISQYFKYAPKGRYYLYSVDIVGLTVDTSPAGEQIKVLGNIGPGRIEKHVQPFLDSQCFG